MSINLQLYADSASSLYVKSRYKRKNKLLVRPYDQMFKSLITDLQNADRKRICLWSIALATKELEDLHIHGDYGSECVCKTSIQMASYWMSGLTTMEYARKFILMAHQYAKFDESKNNIYGCNMCHAIAQACSVVHTVDHAMGFPIYHLTAKLLESKFYEMEDYANEVTIIRVCNENIQMYREILNNGSLLSQYEPDKWAKFIEKNS